MTASDSCGPRRARIEVQIQELDQTVARLLALHQPAVERMGDDDFRPQFEELKRLMRNSFRIAAEWNQPGNSREHHDTDARDSSETERDLHRASE